MSRASELRLFRSVRRLLVLVRAWGRKTGEALHTCQLRSVPSFGASWRRF